MDGMIFEFKHTWKALNNAMWSENVPEENLLLDMATAFFWYDWLGKRTVKIYNFFLNELKVIILRI